MKKIITLALIAMGILTLNSCKELDEFTQFNLDYTTEVTIPANSVINLPLNLATPDVQTNYQNQFSNNNTNTDLVEEIKLAALDIVAKAPQGSNLDFLKSIKVFISADGLDELEIASKSDIPDGLTVLNLDKTDANLKDFVTKETIKLRVETVTDEAITQDRDLEIFTRFRVNAKILGV